MVAPVYNWTGFYVGASLGGRWSDDDWTTTATGLPLGPADPFSPTAKFHPSGVRAGGYVGYNWQVSPSWVFGLEGDAAWADNSKTVRGIPGTFGPNGFGGGPLAATLALDSTRVREGADGSIRVRAGYLISPTWLLYATGGVAFQEVSMNAACLGSANNASWCIAVRNETASSTRVGWTVGGGAEVMLSSNWLLRGEYRYSDFGTLSHLFFATTVDQVLASTRFHTNTATIGIAYKFGGPVVARY
jgi:outer membrane immunogenic protein